MIFLYMTTWAFCLICLFVYPVILRGGDNFSCKHFSFKTTLKGYPTLWSLTKYISYYEPILCTVEETSYSCPAACATGEDQGLDDRRTTFFDSISATCFCIIRRSVGEMRNGLWQTMSTLPVSICRSTCLALPGVDEETSKSVAILAKRLMEKFTFMGRHGIAYSVQKLTLVPHWW